MRKSNTPNSPQVKPKVQYRYVAPFRPTPWQEEPWRDVSPVMLLTGSAGGGKSRLAAEKVHAYCLKYPGATALVLRKIRATMANSTLLFLQRKVIGSDPRVRHKPSEFRFEYTNGSILAYGGMKDDEQREHIRSLGQDGGLDIVWMEEATQFQEEDFNEVLARMRGKAAPWRQIVLTTNPEAPGHWIYVRLILNQEAALYKSRATDNPHNPESYDRQLARLTGTQYKRLVEGEWVSGSGKVIDTWIDDYNPATRKSHGGSVTVDADYILDGGDIVWSIDDGYAGKVAGRVNGIPVFTGRSHPRAILFAQLRQDGTIAVFDESVQIERLATDHIRDAIEQSEKKGYPLPTYVVRDRAAASLEGWLNEFNFRSRYGKMTVDESLKELREWCAADINGVRKVIAHPRCFYLRYQMQTYSVDDKGNIVKEHDDTVDALRYLVWDKSYGINMAVDIATWSSVLND